jgi:hypothetical protein
MFLTNRLIVNASSIDIYISPNNLAPRQPRVSRVGWTCGLLGYGCSECAMRGLKKQPADLGDRRDIAGIFRSIASNSNRSKSWHDRPGKVEFTFPHPLPVQIGTDKFVVPTDCRRRRLVNDFHQSAIKNSQYPSFVIDTKPHVTFHKAGTPAKLLVLSANNDQALQNPGYGRLFVRCSCSHGILRLSAQSTGFT